MSLTARAGGTDRLFASFDGSAAASLPELCRSLFMRQKETWPQVLAAYEAFGTVESRTVRLNGYPLRLQYNPRRITSTVAEVDPASLKNRPCFLCAQNLPAAQKGIDYRGDFLVLVNPFPIFNPHFTVSHVQHIPQLIAGALTAFLQLAADLGPQFTVLYNGALCGASAPDHLHLQIVPAGVMPVEAVRWAEGHRLPRNRAATIAVTASRRTGRSILMVEGREQEEVKAGIERVMAAMQSVLSPSAVEPMMNLCGSHRGGGWRVFIFPRRKHRPQVYYAREEESILVSPGAADMGGLVVTPREADFRRLDETLIRTIFDDVSPDEDTLDKILEMV